MVSRQAAAEVREFWFGELEDGLAGRQRRRRWFMPDAARDAEIRDRFGHLLAAAQRGGLTDWRSDPADALALILVCDQVSRQVHRGTAEAYATDTLAREVARALIEQGADRAFGCDERAFLYMPFQHAESRFDQHASVGLYVALREEVPPAARREAGSFLRHAREHRDVVLRFGRFPHRNRVLGRPSSPEELAFLEGASSYGQSAPSARPVR